MGSDIGGLKFYKILRFMLILSIYIVYNVVRKINYEILENTFKNKFDKFMNSEQYNLITKYLILMIKCIL